MATSVRYHGDGVDLDHPFRSGQSRNDEAGRHRKDALEVFAHGAINGLTVARIGDVERNLADMLEASASFLHEHGEVLHGSLGLGRGVANADALASLEVLAHLPAQEHHSPARLDGLAEIVVELLFWIG